MTPKTKILRLTSREVEVVHSALNQYYLHFERLQEKEPYHAEILKASPAL